MMKRKMKPLGLLLCLLTGMLQSYAQGENNIWINNYAFVSVNFNAGTEPAFGDIPLGATWSGYNSRTASVCDSSGKLLFYTNGRDMYTSTGAAMPHSGIDLPTPNYALTPTLIMKLPGSGSEYYVFTLSSNDTDYAVLYYSIVDMSLNGGAGDVDTLRKNVRIRADLMQSFLVGEHGVNCNMWLSVREKDRNTIITYPITTAGLGQPVTSITGLNISPPQITNSIGVSSYMFGKMSNNGRKMALAAIEFTNGNEYVASMQLLNFDRTTGLFSDGLVLFQHPSDWYWFSYYPSCFSPDDTKLYTVDPQNVDDSCEIVQYDLSQPTASAILQSKTIVDIIPKPEEASSGQSYATDMRLGPDQRIYIAFATPTPPARINKPDLAGVASSVQHNLTPPLSPFTVPVFFAEEALIPTKQAYDNLLGADTQLCYEQELLFHLKELNEGKYIWQDGTEGSSYTVQKEGMYIVTLQSVCGSYADSVKVAFQSCNCTFIQAPTAFSPNGDGLNDEFLPLTNCGSNTGSYNLKIYDRWGNIIFSSANALKGWTGYKGGTPADLGTYFYTVSLTPRDGERTSLFKKGDITLLR